uniref:Guanylate cyclase domain-containing protein n=1 Tax=Romanomermis culicivorax TaxID=13658 RepID=A0A915HTW9_ROMCU
MFKVLDQLMTKYDQLLIFYDVMPMHRVGTSLMLCSGILKENAGHASEIAQVAMQIRQLVKDSGGLVCKMGMHSGQVRSGVVGQNIPQFGIFGDAVNTASRMASTADDFEIQLSVAAEKALRSSSSDFLLDAGKEKEVKGLGKMLIYTLKGYLKYKSAENLPLNGRLDMQTAFKRINTDNETSSLASRLGPSARSPFSGSKVVQQAPTSKKLRSIKGALRSGKSAKSDKSMKRGKFEGFNSKKKKISMNKRTKNTASVRDTNRSPTPRSSHRNARTP